MGDFKNSQTDSNSFRVLIPQLSIHVRYTYNSNMIPSRWLYLLFFVNFAVFSRGHEEQCNAVRAESLFLDEGQGHYAKNGTFTRSLSCGQLKEQKVKQSKMNFCVLLMHAVDRTVVRFTTVESTSEVIPIFSQTDLS